METKTKKKISTRLVEMRQGKDKGICLTKTETSKKAREKNFNYIPDLLPGTLYQLSLVETGGRQRQNKYKDKDRMEQKHFLDRQKQ